MNCTCGNGNPDATRWCPIHHPSIKAHCMGMEFPKRDTDSPRVKWTTTEGAKLYAQRINDDLKLYIETIKSWDLPTAADLDAVAEEQRVKEKTSAQIPNR